jgi:DNA-binding transcriptional MerR regulator
MPESELNLKEMCARFEVTPRTLRYYEYIELLTPRKVGRARFYGPREIARTTLILRGRRFGFSLEDIRQWLELYNAKGSTDQYRALIGMADRQIAELERRRSELTSAIEELRALRDATERDLK